jgi:hypothetical protein
MGMKSIPTPQNISLAFFRKFRGYQGIGLPSGNLLHTELERSTMLFMGKFAIAMVIFHSYVKLPVGIDFPI